MPSIYWALGFLLLPENSAHLQAVVAEAQQAAAAAAHAAAGCEAEGQEPSMLPTAEQLGGLIELASDRHSRVAAAVSEALRLRCFSIDVRIAASDGVLPGGTDGSGPGIWVQQARACGSCWGLLCGATAAAALSAHTLAWNPLPLHTSRATLWQSAHMRATWTAASTAPHPPLLKRTTLPGPACAWAAAPSSTGRWRASAGCRASPLEVASTGEWRLHEAARGGMAAARAGAGGRCMPCLQAHAPTRLVSPCLPLSPGAPGATLRKQSCP